MGGGRGNTGGRGQCGSSLLLLRATEDDYSGSNDWRISPMVSGRESTKGARDPGTMWPPSASSELNRNWGQRLSSANVAEPSLEACFSSSTL